MLSSDILKLINALLPGFLAAWIFYGLTAHPRKDMFERTVQALIFTAIVNVLVYPFRELVLWAGTGSVWNFGPWTEETNLLWSLIVATAMGLIFAGWANNNTVHAWLGNRKWYLTGKHPEPASSRCWTWTKRTSFPSEWFSAFNEDRRYVILHLNDEAQRRIVGWPYEWPDQPDSGHFVLVDAGWLTSENEIIPLPNVKRLLIPAKIVELVEIMLTDDEIRARENPDTPGRS